MLFCAVGIVWSFEKVGLGADDEQGSSNVLLRVILLEFIGASANAHRLQWRQHQCASILKAIRHDYRTGCCVCRAECNACAVKNLVMRDAGQKVGRCLKPAVKFELNNLICRLCCLPLRGPAGTAIIFGVRPFANQRVRCSKARLVCFTTAGNGHYQKRNQQQAVHKRHFAV